MQPKITARTWFGLPAIAVTITLFVVPFLAVMWLGIFGGAGRRQGWIASLTSANFPALLGTTIAQAALSTALAVALGLPCAWVIARSRFAGVGVFRLLITIPFVLPTVVVGLAFSNLFSPGGWLGDLGLSDSFWVIVIAHGYFNFAVVARAVGSVWATLDERTTLAARTLGASSLTAFRTVTLRALAPAIVSAAILVFLYCATSFGVVLILGGSRVRTLETEIYIQTFSFFDVRTAAALSFVQAVIVIALLIVLTRLPVVGTARVATQMPTVVQGRPIVSHSVRGRLGAIVVATAVSAFVVVPLVSLVRRSLAVNADGGLSLDAYRMLASPVVNGVSPLAALRMSLGTAVGAAALALLLGVLGSAAIAGSVRRLSGVLNALMTIPVGVSAVTVGLGYIILLPLLPRSIPQSGALMMMVQALLAVPLVVRVCTPALVQISERLRQAAGVLGARPFRVFVSIDVPLIARPIAAAAGFAFVLSLGEFGASTFVARPNTTTLPVLIGQMFGRPGWLNSAVAASSSTLLVVATLVVLALIDLSNREGW